MNRFAALVLGVILAAPAALVATQLKSQPAGPGSADAEFRALSDQYVKALRAGDVKGLLALYTDDAVEMRPNMPLIKGKAALQQFFENTFAASTLDKFSLNHIEMRASGDMGYDAGTFTQTFTPTNSKPINDSGKYVAICKRTGGVWKVAYLALNSDNPPLATNTK